MAVTFSDDEYAAQNPSVIRHYGTPRHSGRYPWGSGEEGGARRNTTLLSEVEHLKKTEGLTDTQAANRVGLTTTQLRDMRTLARNERKQDEIHMARKLKATGMSNVAIAREMTKSFGYKVGDTQVGNLLKESQERKVKVLENVADTLRRAVEEKEYLDIGAGIEYQLTIPRTKFRAALRILKDEGYVVHPIKMEQLSTGKQTNMLVLTKPGTSWADVARNKDKIKQLTEYSDDGGYTSLGMLPPLSLSSKRVGIVYKEQGGDKEDGVMYVRRGVSDVSLGKKPYAQVRVLVDGTHYLKGMAIYKDPEDMPPGVDVLFNTNKSDTGNKLDALKPKADDPDNPFGATVRQIGERSEHDGKITKLTSTMNLVNEAGDWNKWSKSLSSQFLSKQPTALAKDQLDQTYLKRTNELQTIPSLTNPSVKKRLLEAYADGTDAAAVHLKAAAMPKQRTQVILPLKDIKPDQVYAPSFDNGTRVALVRFPHGGTFEIPELTVNNKNPSGIKLLGPKAEDAIGIHPDVAERLSGADFDGDNVLVIPNNHGAVRSTRALDGLKGFDAKAMYPHYEGMKVMTAYETGLEMGMISNLITDMTIQHATTDELARAVRHSMVVIDAKKHKLDYKRSEKDNNILALKQRYQPGKQHGAATLISRATSRKDVLDRKLRSAAKGGPIDSATGKLVYEYTNKQKTWTDAKGVKRTKDVKLQSTKLAETDDAHTLSSGTVIEAVYADHSNRMKKLANQARLELLKVQYRPYSPSARKTYATEVQSLNDKLTKALKNAPRERQAQVIANRTVKVKLQENPELNLQDNAAEKRRMKRQALTAARLITDAKKAQIDITPQEWKAIDAGAITHTKLDDILSRADLDKVKELATPRDLPKLSSGSLAKARALHEKGLTWAEVAEALGVSVSTVQKELSGGDED